MLTSTTITSTSTSTTSTSTSKCADKQSARLAAGAWRLFRKQFYDDRMHFVGEGCVVTQEGHNLPRSPEWSDHGIYCHLQLHWTTSDYIGLNGTTSDYMGLHRTISNHIIYFHLQATSDHTERQRMVSWVLLPFSCPGCHHCRTHFLCHEIFTSTHTNAVTILVD